jgi:hypothetical protein
VSDHVEFSTPAEIAEALDRVIPPDSPHRRGPHPDRVTVAEPSDAQSDIEAIDMAALAGWAGPEGIKIARFDRRHVSDPRRWAQWNHWAGNWARFSKPGSPEQWARQDADRQAAAAEARAWLDSVTAAADPLSVDGIAERLGVRPDTVHKWRARGLGMPEPRWQAADTSLWFWPDVWAWARRTGRA